MNYERKFDAVAYDLETHGTEPGSVILSLGATEFSTLTGSRGERFFRSFDVEPQLALGLKEDSGTIAWWRKPEQAEARPFLQLNRVPFARGLEEFSQWLKARDTRGGFWSRGFFDANLLGAAYIALGRPKPWKYWLESDARSIIRVAMMIDGGFEEPDFEGVKHHADDDAYNEAKLVYCAIEALRKGSGL